MSATLDEPPSPRSGAARRPPSGRLLLGLAATLMAGGAVVAVLLVQDDDGQNAVPPMRSTTSQPPPPATAPEAVALRDLVERGRRLTFHARYTAVGPVAVPVTIDVWRRADLVRQDTRSQQGEHVVLTSSLRRGDETTSCTKQGDGAWRCSLATTSGVPPDPLLGDIVRRLEQGPLTVRDETVAGRAARCFAVTYPSGDAELCLTAEDGIPARVLTAGAGLQLSGLDRDVDDEVFNPPARPASATTSTAG